MNQHAEYIVERPNIKVLLLAVLILLAAAPCQTLRAQDVEDSESVVAAPEEEVEPVSGNQSTALPEPFIFRDVPDSIAKKIQRQKDFAYANDPGYWVKEPVTENRRDFWDYFYSFFSNVAVRTIVYSLLIAFFLFVIYRLVVVNNLFLFYRSKKIKQKDGDEPMDIEDESLDEKIQKAIDQNDHRMAVRYMYLKALQVLNQRQWIRFHAEATNYEYVNQMRGRKMANEFDFLTRVYDYVWYGEFALTREQFEIVYNNFRHFYNAVNS